MKNELIAFRMCGVIEFDRPIDKEKDYISVGGFEMTMQGHNINFDFEESYGTIDKSNGCLYEFELKNPDYDTFEDLSSITEEMLSNVESIEEFLIYTGEDGESDIKPVCIKELYFVLPYDHFKEIQVSTDLLKTVEI